MPGSVWVQNVQHIQDGEAVAAAVAGRPDRALESRSNYLRDRLDAAESGEGVVAHGVVLAPVVQAGQAVAFDPLNNRFDRALAEVVTDPETGSFVASWRADCLGVVLVKTSATSGDVLLGGRAVANLTNAGVTLPGRYYLSSLEPGKLTSQAPAASVPVLYFDGTYAYLTGSSRSFLEAHVHHKFSLYCRPAGTTLAPAPGARHVITVPNPSLPGWLPADHASFNGTAPTGAAWGYNLAAHPQLQRAWPPVPVSSSVLVWDRLELGGDVIPYGLASGICQVNRDGIWWMSDCNGEVPWPADYDSSNPPPLPGPYTDPPTCPPTGTMQLHLWFAEMLLATDKTVVTSLAAQAGSPLRVLNCDGQTGSTGALTLDLDLAFLTDSINIDGARVFKDLAGTTFKRGYVVEALTAGANVQLTPTVTGTGGKSQGTVRIDVATDLSGRAIAPEIVRVSNARERFFKEVPYLGFPPGIGSWILLKYRIPSAGLPANPAVILRPWLFCQSAGTLPATTTAYRLLPAPGVNLVDLPTADTAVVCNTNVAIGAAQYREVASATIPVTAGSILLVLFTRAGGDGFAGELGLLSCDASLVAG